MANTLPLPGVEERRPSRHSLPESIVLKLAVDDPETVAALAQCDEGPDRDAYALKALRIGVLALGQARGQIDVQAVRGECEKMLVTLQSQLREHAGQVQQRLGESLHGYFNPQDGKFHERVERLIRGGGELETVLRRQIGPDDSLLGKTLANHFGPTSPLMKQLSPTESEGLLSALKATFGQQLEAQREAVLNQFSLNNKDGALTRLLQEITTKQGQLTENLQGKIEAVVKEFNLNEDGSALNRLMTKVTEAQRKISEEFSSDNEQSTLSQLTKMLKSAGDTIHGNLTLDDEQSALSRLKRELVSMLNNQAESNQKFQEEVKVAVAALSTKRNEAHSTRHGAAFETAVFEFVQHVCQPAGDVAEFTGASTGQIKNCKKGDVLIELGPDGAAAGGKICIEAKEEQSCDLKKARLEIEEGRKNRGAQVGLFVFSKKTAPAGVDPLARYGDDVYCVWDPEDPQSDLFLKAGLTLAKALCSRAVKSSEAMHVDFAEIDEAILETAKRAKSLDEIYTWSQTIVSNGEKILDHVRKSKKALERQCEILTERMDVLKHQLAEKQ